MISLLCMIHKKSYVLRKWVNLLFSTCLYAVEYELHIDFNMWCFMMCWAWNRCFFLKCVYCIHDGLLDLVPHLSWCFDYILSWGRYFLHGYMHLEKVSLMIRLLVSLLLSFRTILNLILGWMIPRGDIITPRIR